MQITFQVAKRSTCPRAAVGAVIVRDKRILTTGYNGSPAGLPHCTEVGCLMVNDHCVRTLHAEQNAIIQGALHGVDVSDSTIYVTHQPCLDLRQDDHQCRDRAGRLCRPLSRRDRLRVP